MANTRQTVRTAGELAELASAIEALIGRASKDGSQPHRNGSNGLGNGAGQNGSRFVTLSRSAVDDADAQPHV